MFFRYKYIFLLLGSALLLSGAGFFFAVYPSRLENPKLEVLSIQIKEKPVLPITMFFTGDIMLDRSVAKRAEEYGNESLLAKVAPLFKGNDLIIGNLEGTITDNVSIARKDHSLLHFTFDPELAHILSDNGFTHVSLSNNHSLDFGWKGYEKTKEYLKEFGIDFFGSARNDDNLSTIVEVKGKHICFVGYHQLFSPDESGILSEIARIRPTCDFLILTAHWGIEYKNTQSVEQTRLAHEFIDTGADLIIGTHPHVVQPVEIYKNKAIFYSLGNFIFDQYFSPETSQGLAVSLELSDTRSFFKLIPVSIHYGEVSFATSEIRKEVMKAVTGTALPLDISSSILDNYTFSISNGTSTRI
jgi:poly-gamma-glutamate synthesis protein (capsule biosynthesis protein)